MSQELGVLRRENEEMSDMCAVKVPTSLQS
jgi:hypothetical protein